MLIFVGFLRAAVVKVVKTFLEIILCHQESSVFLSLHAVGLLLLAKSTKTQIERPRPNEEIN